jgi:hypothetical protein
MARITGSRGSIYLSGSGTKLADSYMWEFEENQEVLDSSIKGEFFRQYTADQGHARVRVQSFVSSTSATPLTSVMNTSLVAAHGAGTRVAFVLDMVDAGTIVSGSGFLVRSTLHVARDGIITDEIEIEVDGPLTTVA